MPTFTGDTNANTLSGTATSDVISGLGGSDTLAGGDGDDFIYGHSAGGISAINSTVIASGLALPVGGATTAADPGFLYVVEKETGVIWRIDAATGAKTTFLDIAQNQFSTDSERGVLGVAFHPDYENNGRFFVYLTDPSGNIQIREFHRSAGDPHVADTSSTLVIEIQHPGQSNHNGGWLGFSPSDGYLYFGTGDGGGGGDTSNNAQNLTSLLGKIIRIDVNSDDFTGDANRNYHIPGDNPFVGVTGADEIWAYGVRNPWRMAFDPRNGDLYIGDVGQSAREEIDYHAATAGGGFNFGWRIMEGTQTFTVAPPPAPQPGDPSLIAPIYDYGRDIGSTVTGGEIYLGGVSDFVGQYVFADFGSGRLFSLSVVNGATVDVTDRTAQITGATPSSIVDFVTGSDGSLYAIGIGGTIWRLDPVAAADGADIIDGGAGNDHLWGNAGNDTLIGGTGADTMAGGDGDDTYSVDSLSDVVTENAGEGAGDAVLVTLSGYTLAANIEVGAVSGATGLTLTGNGLGNVLYGGAGGDTLNGAGGNDTLQGGGGADAMSGGLGNDTFFVAQAGDTVNENLGEGTDAVIVQMNTAYTLAANVEIGATFLGSGVDITGNGLDNQLYGGGAADTLNGAGGNDTIQGAGGNDVMIGGTGNDTYFLEDSGDTITESADEGSDAVIVFTSSYTLAANVEVGARFLTTAYALTGNALDNQLYGNNGDDTLNGGDGNDTLQGGGGNDIMVGGAGDDTYFVEQAGDGVTENSNEGNDAAIVLIGSYTLAANVEVGATFLTSGVSITGNGLDNQLYGNAGADTLSGAAGADLLDGGAGADMLTGGSENDVFVFVAGQGNGDTVTDFAGNGASAGDTLRFSGYGTVGASFVQLDSTHWQINSADGTIHDTITLANGAGVDASDWMFV